VRGKMEDGQLDECTLTFRDIGKICSAFETVLQGVFHERIEYPSVDLSRAQHHGEDKTSRKQTVGAKQTEVKP
jgi:predicted membrane-associated HD superfamily hydrolase